MQVETYEILDTIPLSEMQALAEEGESAMLIEQLNLEGQKSRKDEVSDGHKYRVITSEERFVFRTLFPNKTPIEKYKDGPIPLRVLQIAAHVRSLNIPELQYLEVWHPQPGIDDPVLVARPSAYSDPSYILARWGHALKPFSELLESALTIAEQTAESKLITIRDDINSKLLNLKNYVRKHYLDGKIPTPTFYE